MRLSVKFDRMANGRTLPAGVVQVDTGRTTVRPLETLVAEAVETYVRSRAEGGKHLGLQVEPHGGSPNGRQFYGELIIDQGPQNERVPWAAVALPAPSGE